MLRRLPPFNAFEAAAEYESFTRAAEELCVTQGEVSHQVKALEAELGIKLFNRERQRLIITGRFAEEHPGIDLRIGVAWSVSSQPSISRQTFRPGHRREQSPALCQVGIAFAIYRGQSAASETA
jgi:hypothetical protein